MSATTVQAGVSPDIAARAQGLVDQAGADSAPARSVHNKEAPRTNRHSPHPDHGSSDVDEGEVVACQSVEPGGEAAEVLELVEASLDAIAQLVDCRIVGDRGLA